MSQPVLVSTLQERVRVLCNLPSFTGSTPVTSAAILEFLKSSFTRLGAIVKQYTDEQLLTASGTAPTVASVATVTLPTNFSDLIRLVWLKTATEEVPLTWADSDEFVAQPQWGLSSPWGGYGEIRYRLMGPDKVELFPTPPAVYTLKLYYTTGIYVTATSDSVIMRDGWDDWIVFNACGLVRMRQQKTAEDPGPGSFFAQRKEVEQEIRSQLKRDRFGRKHIKDTRGSTTAALGVLTRAGRRRGF